MEDNKKTSAKGNDKPTYEQLAQMNGILKQQYINLEQRLQQLDNVFTRLNYLFNVLDRAQYFKADFVEACATEIQDLLDTRGQEEVKE